MLRTAATAWVLLAMVAAWTPATLANDLNFRRISADEGLSNDTVFSVVQDRQGFMWFGTANGLNRHDGIATKVFRNDPNDPQSLSDSWVRQVLVDRDGHIWVGTMTRGLNRLDPVTDGFIKYQFDPNDPGTLSDNSIRALYQDREGDLWVGTQSGGLNRLDTETGRFERFTHRPSDSGSLSDIHIEVIYETRDGVIWIGTKSGGLNRFDRETGTFERYQADPSRPNSLAHNDVRGIYEDPGGVLWIATWGGGLQRLNRRTGEFLPHRAPTSDSPDLISDNIRQVLEDSQGDLWVATSGGLSWLDTATGHIRNYQHDPGDPRSLSHNHVRGMYEDRQGGLWLATMGGGVNRLDLATKSFNSQFIDVDRATGASGAVPMALSESSDGTLWVGTNGSGLVRFRDGQSAPETLKADSSDPNSLSHNNIWALLEDSSGALWIGTESGGLDVLREGEGGRRFANYRHDPSDLDSLSNDHVTAILEDSPGYLWIGTDGGGLNLLDIGDGKFTHFRHDPFDSSSLSYDHVISIYKDRYGLLWVGTWGGGLNVLARDRSQFTHYRQDPLEPQSLSDDTIFSIAEDPNGALWIATANGGLNRFDRERASFEHFGPSEGLEVNALICLQPDDIGNLWVGSLNGLFRLQLTTLEFDRFMPNDGVISHQLSKACLRNSRGEIVFGGWNGLTRFLPGQVAINTHKPPAAITGLRLNHELVPLGSSSSQTAPEFSIDIEPDQSIITIDFAALDYRDPKRNRYRYRLDGFEKDWRDVGSGERRATYTNLDPGDYTFQVQVSNNHGIWNEVGASLQVHQLPAWWQTWWSIAGFIVALAGLLAAAYRARTQRLATDYRRLLRLVEGSPNALLLSRLDGEILYANERAAKLFGFRDHDLVGTRFHSLIASPHLESYEDAVESLTADRSSSPAELVCVANNDQRLSVEATIATIPVGHDVALSIAVRDVSELRMAEQELGEALAESAGLRKQLSAENRMLRQEIAGVASFDEIIGDSDGLKEALLRVEKVAGTDASVLIIGETGTGKELIARALHQRSERRDAPFMTVNCAAIQPNLVESELFGYEKGAFTGAVSQRLGRFEIANGGTLFLDEIGDLAFDLQAKLLRVLESGEYSRLGSNETLHVDVRVLAATNRDLPEALNSGSFRSDLYFRIAAFSIVLPPLRERRDDIPLLVWHFVKTFNSTIGKSIDKIPEGLMERLVSHRWAGNVRELRNVIQNGVIMTRGSTLRLPEFAPVDDSAVRQPVLPAAPARLDEAERTHIISVLEASDWKINGKGNAADRLGVNPSTLRFRMKKHGIKRPGKSLPSTR